MTNESSRSGMLCIVLMKEIEQLLYYYHTPPHFTEEYNTKQLSQRIKELLHELYLRSEEQNQFWWDCPMSTYKKTFKNRYRKIKHSQPGYRKLSFLIEEYKILNDLDIDRGSRDFDEVYGLIIKEPLTISTSKGRDTTVHLDQIFKDQQQKKLSYIRTELLLNGWDIVKEAGEYRPIKSVLNPFPEIFKGRDNKAYKLFKRYVKDYKPNESLKEWSFLIFRMIDVDLMHNISQKEICYWLKDQDFLPPDLFNEFLNKGQLETRKNCKSNKRITQFEELFNSYYPSLK